MKQEVTPTMWVVIIAVAVLVIGFLGWRNFGGHGGGAMDRATIDAHMAAKRAKEGGSAPP